MGREARPRRWRSLLSFPPASRLGRSVSVFALSFLFLSSGANHFFNTGFYTGIMPAYLPAHRELVYLSGVLEVFGGVGLLFPFARARVGVGLVLLLVAVFPANLHMAMTPEAFAEFSVSALYLRLPLQFVLMAWVLWATRQVEPPKPPEGAPP